MLIAVLGKPPKWHEKVRKEMIDLLCALANATFLGGSTQARLQDEFHEHVRHIHAIFVYQKISMYCLAYSGQKR